MYPHQRERLSAVLTGQGLAAMVTTSPLNIAWATSTTPASDTPPRALVVTPAASVLLAESGDADAGSLSADEVLRYGSGRLGTMADALAATLTTLEARDAVALDATVDETALHTVLQPRETTAGAAAWRRARAVKSPFELDCLERGLVVLEETLNAAIQVLAPGMTARHSVQLCEQEAARRGMALEHAVIATTAGGRRAFRAGDILRLELSGYWKGYYAVVARAAVLGKPVLAQDEAHAAVEAPLAAAIHAIAPGVTAGAVHAAATAAGPQIAVSGGGIGLEAEELPAMGPDSDERLEPGMVLSLSTRASTGVRLVDTVLVTSRSFRRLNRSHAALVSLD